MLRRLTALIVAVALSLIVLICVVGSVLISHSVREDLNDFATGYARRVAALLEEERSSGNPPDQARLDDLNAAGTRLVVLSGDDQLTATGELFNPAKVGQPIVGTATVGDTTVTVVTADRSVRSLNAAVRLHLGLLMLGGLIASILAAYLIARGITRPLVALAGNADALGRGRFDIEPPASSVPELRALGRALKSSARNLETHLRNSREAAQLTSHALRTPLTGMRLELEELLLRDGLDDEVRHAVERCLGDTMRLQQTVNDVVAFERSRGLTGGQAVRLDELRDVLSARWAKRLGSSRDLTVRVDGGEDLLVTRGPVEQVLDTVLADVVAHGKGPVELELAAEETHVRIRVSASCKASTPPVGPRAARESGESVTELLGGRWAGDALLGALEILLPRR